MLIIALWLVMEIEIIVNFISLFILNFFDGVFGISLKKIFWLIGFIFFFLGENRGLFIFFYYIMRIDIMKGI